MPEHLIIPQFQRAMGNPHAGQPKRVKLSELALSSTQVVDPRTGQILDCLLYTSPSPRDRQR